MGLWLHLLPRDGNFYDNVTAKPSALRASEEARLRFTPPRTPSRPRSHLGLPASRSWAVGRRDLLLRGGGVGGVIATATRRELPIRHTERRKSRPHRGDATSAARSAPRRRGRALEKGPPLELNVGAAGGGVNTGVACDTGRGATTRTRIAAATKVVSARPRPHRSSAFDISLFSREGGRGPGENRPALEIVIRI